MVRSLCTCTQVNLVKNDTTQAVFQTEHDSWVPKPTAERLNAGKNNLRRLVVGVYRFGCLKDIALSRTPFHGFCIIR